MSNKVSSAKALAQIAAIPAAADCGVPAEIADMIERLRVTPATEIQPKNFLIDLNGVPFLVKGEITIVRGRKKGGKSSFIRDIVRSLYEDDNLAKPRLDRAPRVGYFDCEMSKSDTKKIFNNFKPTTDLSNLHAWFLREEADKIGIIKRLTEFFSYDAIIIDTIGDWVMDMNDEATSTAMALDWLSWVSRQDVACLAIMHVNKNDTNAQGHWGHQLEKKCHDSLLVEMVGDYEKQVITHTDCREYHVPKFECVIENGVRKYRDFQRQTSSTKKQKK